MKSNQLIDPSSFNTSLSSPIAEHIERIYRLKPDSGRLFEDFPELLAYHEMSRRLVDLIWYIRSRDSDPNFRPQKAREHVLNELHAIVVYFKQRIIRAHVHRHLKIMKTNDTINSLSKKIAIAEAQVILLEKYICYIEESENPFGVQWACDIAMSGLRLLETILKVCEEQRTIGYLIYTSIDDGKTPYSQKDPPLINRQRMIGLLRKLGIIA